MTSTTPDEDPTIEPQLDPLPGLDPRLTPISPDPEPEPDRDLH